MLFNVLDSEEVRWAAVETEIIHANTSLSYISFSSISYSSLSFYTHTAVSYNGIITRQVWLAKQTTRQHQLCFSEHCWQGYCIVFDAVSHLWLTALFFTSNAFQAISCAHSMPPNWAGKNIATCSTCFSHWAQTHHWKQQENAFYFVRK